MFIDFSERIISLIENLWPKLPAFFLTLAVGYLFIKVGLFIFERLLKAFRFNKSIQGLILSLVDIVLWVMLVAEIARQVGLSNLAITISSSIFALGFAIANGASAMAADIIAGLNLARDKDFECGYRIKVGDIEGIVKKIDIRKVRIEGEGGKIHVLPNSKIDNANGWTVIDRGDKS